MTKPSFTFEKNEKMSELFKKLKGICEDADMQAKVIKDKAQADLDALSTSAQDGMNPVWKEMAEIGGFPAPEGDVQYGVDDSRFESDDILVINQMETECNCAGCRAQRGEPLSLGETLAMMAMGIEVDKPSAETFTQADNDLLSELFDGEESPT